MLPHLVLLGDSVIDNGAYIAGGPDVLTQVRSLLPSGWRADSVAVDGATTAAIPRQLARVASTATHLLVSIGGNNALRHMGLLDMPVSSSGQALVLLDSAVSAFSIEYRAMADACVAQGLPTTVFTIYEGHFADKQLRAAARVAIGAFNDVIARAARERGIAVLELRDACNRPEHFANQIEPSVKGGLRTAEAIVRLVRTTGIQPRIRTPADGSSRNGLAP